MIRRLKIKFVCITMSLVTVILLCVLAAVLELTQASLQRESLRTMWQIALNPARPQAPDEEFNGMRLPYFVLEVDRDGRVQQAGGGYYDLSDTEFLQNAVDQAVQTRQPSGMLEDYGLRFLRVEMPQTGYIVFADVSGEVRTLNGLLRSCLLICGGAFFAFLALSILLARWAVGPVERAWVQQRQFVADANHELKTPLTVILTDAELLQAPENTGPERERLARDIGTVSRQMKELVERLLELARADREPERADRRPVDWSDAVEQALLPFEPVYYEKGLGLDVNLCPGVRVRGNAEQLRRVAAILLDNGQKYAAPASVVHVSLCREGRQAVLSVTSRGDTIPPEELPKLFKRFYRADPDHRHGDGCGLGLAIAQQIVTAHRGRIRAASDQGINTFSVILRTVPARPRFAARLPGQ